MSVRAKTTFIVGWIVFIIVALSKMAHDALKVYTLTEEKFRLILMTTLFFVTFALMAIVLILRRFGHSVGEIRNLHKFIVKAIEVEEAESKNQKYLTTIESKEYNMGYFLLAVIVSAIVFYGISVMLIIEKGHEFFEILLESILQGIVVALLAANLLLPLIHYAIKNTLSDGRRIAFGIPAKFWMVIGVLMFLFNTVSHKEFYLIAGISTFFVGLTAYLYLKRPIKALIAVYIAFVSLPYIWMLKSVI